MPAQLQTPAIRGRTDRSKLGWAAIGAGLLAAGGAAWLAWSQRAPKEEPPTAPPGAVPPEVLEEIRQLEEAIKRLEEALAAAEQTAQEIARIIEEQAKTIAELEQVVSELRRKVAEAEALLQDILANIDRIAQQNRDLETLAKQLEAEYGEKDARFRQLVALIQEQQATIETLRSQVQELQRIVQELSAEVDRLESLVEELRRQNQQLQALIAQLQAQLAAARAEIDTLNQIVAQLRYELEPVEHTLTVGIGFGTNTGGHAREERQFYVPYRQKVSIRGYVHEQLRCGFLWCQQGSAYISLRTSGGSVIWQYRINAWICSNCAEYPSAEIELNKGIYKLYVDQRWPAAARISATFKAPRFLGRTADPDVCRGCRGVSRRGKPT